MKIYLLPLLAALCACATEDGKDAHYQAQDNTIKVMLQPNGRLSPIAPACRSFDDAATSEYLNNPLPQLGCASAGNLARQIVDPSDLVRGEIYGDRDAIGQPVSGTVGAAAIQRYNEGKVYVPVNPSDSSNGSTDTGGS